MKQHPLYSHFGAKLKREDAEGQLGLQPGKKNILFFGLIRQYKGLDILLEAFKNLDINDSTVAMARFNVDNLTAGTAESVQCHIISKYR